MGYPLFFDDAAGLQVGLQDLNSPSLPSCLTVLLRDFTMYLKDDQTRRAKIFWRQVSHENLKGYEKTTQYQIPWQWIITQHAVEMSLQNWNGNNVHRVKSFGLF